MHELNTGITRRLPLTAFLAIAIFSVLLLATGTERIPMTASYQDRVSQIRSQDEATYSRVALEMLDSGDWLTPRIMGRYFLYKPPLLYWLSALSVKCLGVSRLALRLPNVLAGGLAVALMFAWCRFIGAWQTGLIGAVVMLSNSVWQSMSRVACMDVLLTCCILIALFFLLRDPGITRNSTVIGFGCATAAALMTKSIAGSIPLLVLGAFALAAGAGRRPAFRRVLLAGAVACGLAAPWHVYELVAHPIWFLNEYIGTQLFGFGAHPPVPSHELAFWFYGRRLFDTDPVLVLFFLIGVPRLLIAVRHRNVQALILGLWLAVTILAVCGFQARNFLYAVLLIPPMCLVAAGYSAVPLRARWIMLFILLGLGIGKVYASETWDLAFYRITAPDTQRNLRSYSGQARPNELIVVQPDDDFYSMLLPIHGVRYCWSVPIEALANYAPHLVERGISVTAEQFVDLGKYQPGYESELRGLGLPGEPIATSIAAPDASDVVLIVGSRPASDFYLPRQLAEDHRVEFEATHAIQPASADRVFLLARTAPAAVRATPIHFPAGTL